MALNRFALGVRLVALSWILLQSACSDDPIEPATYVAPTYAGANPCRYTDCGERGGCAVAPRAPLRRAAPARGRGARASANRRRPTPPPRRSRPGGRASGPPLAPLAG